MTTPLSLLFFAAHQESASLDTYELLLRSSRIADDAGFQAIWLPERHFNAFGGLYPNPATLAAALAIHTRRVRLRSGSVVMPLQDPLRVAEEWSVVDNLSHGRVDLGFAQGWNPADFAMAPERYERRLEITLEGIRAVQALWQGKTIPRTDGNGNTREVRTYPLPVQRDLNIWLTCSGSVERFAEAGRSGYNVLTALLFMSPAELEQRITAYRAARSSAGLDPAQGRVTLMLHTLVADDESTVIANARGPLKEYLKQSFPLWKERFTDLVTLSTSEREKLWEFAFHRYYRTSGLFGTLPKAVDTIAQYERLGVNEIACLIDFGVERELACRTVSLLGTLLQQGTTAPRRSERVVSASSSPPWRDQ